MIVDTSYLIALLVAEDSNHSKAVADGQALQEPASVPDRVLEEMVSTLTYKRGIEFGLMALDKVRSNKRFQAYSINPTEAEGTFELMKRVQRKLNFTDYLIVHLAQTRSEGVLSYDHQLLSVLKGSKGD